MFRLVGDDRFGRLMRHFSCILFSEENRYNGTAEALLRLARSRQLPGVDLSKLDHMEEHARGSIFNNGKSIWLRRGCASCLPPLPSTVSAPISYFIPRRDLSCFVAVLAFR